MANTKIPWRLTPRLTITDTVSPKGHVIAEIKKGRRSQREMTANARFIIKAVNNHDALVSALEKIVDECSEFPCIEGGYLARKTAKQALAKVKEIK